jgi:hypothetical protein
MPPVPAPSGRVRTSDRLALRRGLTDPRAAWRRATACGRDPASARWRRDVVDSACDRWWVEWVRIVLSIDMLVKWTLAAPPEPAFSWQG